MQQETPAKQTRKPSAEAAPKPSQPSLQAPQLLHIPISGTQSILQRAEEDPLSLSRADLQVLQATAGEGAVQRLLNRSDVRQARRFDVPVPD